MSSALKTKVARRLLELRTRSGKHQKEFAEGLGFKQGTWSKWENGKDEPRLSNLVRISGGTGEPLSKLLGLRDPLPWPWLETVLAEAMQVAREEGVTPEDGYTQKAILRWILDFCMKALDDEWFPELIEAQESPAKQPEVTVEMRRKMIRLLRGHKRA